MKEAFNVISAIVSVPEGMKADVILRWIDENYSQVRARQVPLQGDVARDGIAIEAMPFVRLNNMLRDLQENESLLRRRGAEVA